MNFQNLLGGGAVTGSTGGASSAPGAGSGSGNTGSFRDLLSGLDINSLLSPGPGEVAICSFNDDQIKNDTKTSDQ